ncbi:MAG: insulinase family protein [Bacteroidales bacterium]|nr:insulinase family protein [Bacteroidales bacterium]
MHYDKFTLENGLRVLFHQDKNTPIAAINLIYDVGAKDEDPEKTGWAHLLEHLMFEGSLNIDEFDLPLQKVGGSNNAFTNNDYTNYYMTLPKENIETALWLESDRMISLAFDKKKFETQKSVVIEEFKQTALNEPYGDDMMLLRELAYKKHPYRWSTIGREISHIEKATLEAIKEFYFHHYAPNNAILSIGGNFTLEYIKEIVQKWFGDIPAREISKRKLPEEPEQTERRELTVYRKVPFDMIYMSFHCGSRLDDDYYIFDIITDVLDDGKSSRLYQRLVKDKHIFDDIEAFITGNNDLGMVIFSGRPVEGISMEEAEKYIWQEIDDLKNNFVTQNELTKSINSLEFSLAYLETKVTSKVSSLGFYELIGDVDLINNEKERYTRVTAGQIKKAANRVFQPEKVSVLYYLAENEE